MSLKFTDIKQEGYERVLLAEESVSGFYSIIAVHNTKRGPALGGCRFFDYQGEDDQKEDVLKLSKAMTYKNSLANLDFGGGKATINSKVPKNKMYELYGKMLDHLNGSYITAGDIGIVDQDLVELKKYSNYVCSTKGTDSGQSTAYGVFNAILGYNEYKYKSSSIESKKIVLKGFGKVGSRLAHFCKEAGAKVEVVDFEFNRSIIERDGFKFLSKYQNTSFDRIDIFSPCATGGDLNTEFIEFAKSVNIDCVIGAANNQLENNTIEKNLFDMGITFCPDYCVNAGGVIILALRSSIKEDMEYLDTEAKNKLIGIKNQLIKILTLSKEKNQLTTISSNELAEAGFQ